MDKSEKKDAGDNNKGKSECKSAVGCTCVVRPVPMWCVCMYVCMFECVYLCLCICVRPVACNFGYVFTSVYMLGSVHIKY